MVNQVQPPQISDSTMKEMAKFFMKTSVPRILEEKQNSKVERKHFDQRGATPQ